MTTESPVSAISISPWELRLIGLQEELESVPETEREIGKIILESMTNLRTFLDSSEVECDTGRKIHAFDEMVSAFHTLQQGINIKRGDKKRKVRDELERK